MPRTIIAFLKQEILIGIVFNIPYFLLLFFYLPFYLKESIDCDMILTILMIF